MYCENTISFSAQTYLYTRAIKFDVIANKYMTDIKVMNKAIDQIFVIIFKCISCVHDLLKLFTLRATK